MFETTQVHPRGHSVGPVYACPPPGLCYEAITPITYVSGNAYTGHKGNNEPLWDRHLGNTDTLGMRRSRLKNDCRFSMYCL